jgi:hypothetical protein
VRRLLITIGVLLILAGLLWAAFPRAVEWFGNLPGDIDVRRGNSRIFIPLGSMLLVSVVLTLLVNLLAWLSRFFE